MNYLLFLNPRALLQKFTVIVLQNVGKRNIRFQHFTFFYKTYNTKD